LEGYIDLRILKLHSVLLGSAPAGMNYRFSTCRERAAAAEVDCVDEHQVAEVSIVPDADQFDPPFEMI
jgi:hypothetical protein